MAFAEDTEGYTALSQIAPQERGKLIVHFYRRPVEDEAKSAAEGRPVYVEQEYIKILTPGDKDNVIDRPVWFGANPACDNRRYPAEYEAWKRDGSNIVVGTPLSAWPSISRSQIEEMKHFNVRTVEQLAELADAHAQKFLGIQKLKQGARDFLEQAKGGAVTTRLRAENDSLKKQLDEQAEQLKELVATVDVLRRERERDDAPAKGPRK